MTLQVWEVRSIRLVSNDDQVLPPPLFALFNCQFRPVIEPQGVQAAHPNLCRVLPGMCAQTHQAAVSSCPAGFQSTELPCQHGHLHVALH
jgi:hypothetical protein